MASKHAIQNWDEEMTRNETGGETQRVRLQPVRYEELANANQENVAVLIIIFYLLQLGCYPVAVAF